VEEVTRISKFSREGKHLNKPGIIPSKLKEGSILIASVFTEDSVFSPQGVASTSMVLIDCHQQQKNGNLRLETI
jgi:hypothetical protein